MSIERLTSRLLLATAALALAGTIACASSSPTSPGNAITVTGQGITTYTYTNDIQPLLASTCVICHGPTVQNAGFDFSTYAGVLRALTPGSDQSLIVLVTQPGGLMYNNLSGNKDQKAGLIYDWVVNSHAAQ